MDLLCHYTNHDTAKIIIDTLSLKFGKIVDSNDPIEIKKLDFDYSGKDRDIQKEICIALKAYLDNILQMICFSEGIYPFDDDEYIEENGHYFSNLEFRPPFYLPRMWALYGGNHKGVCFVFDKIKLIKEIIKQIKKEYNYINKSMTYADFLNSDILFKMKESQLFNEETIKKDRHIKSIQDYLDKNAHINYFFKDNDWENEHEYRFLCWNKSKNMNFDKIKINFSKSLQAIILGFDFENTKEFMCIANKNNDIPVFKLVNDQHIGIEEIY